MMNRRLFSTCLAFGLVADSLLITGCGYVRRPEERTGDGLVRVHSRDTGGVYRAPGAEFRQYKKIILEPAVIAFRAGWREAHPDVSDSLMMRVVQDAVALLYEEFRRELIVKGEYEFAVEPGPDVLMISPRVTDLDLLAPDWSPKTYVPGPVTMQVSGELNDGVSNALVGRVIIFVNDDRHGSYRLRLADRVTNAHEMRLGFRKWSQMVIEALHVAKATRPPT